MSCFNINLFQCQGDLNVNYDLAGQFCFRSVSINKKDLEEEISGLRRIQTEVMRRVSHQEKQDGMKCKAEVTIWLEKVDNINHETSSLHSKIAQMQTYNIFQYYKFKYLMPKKITQLLQQVIELKTGVREFGEHLVHHISSETNLINVHYPSSVMIGRDDVLQDIFNYLHDEKVHTIGIFGMGGIGKTTILMKIEQALQKNRRRYGFEFVILVTAVSKFPNIPRIQNQIASCIGLSLSSQEHEYQRASTLLKHLKDRMYVLLIDDVWQALDFERIGIPLPNNDDNIIKLVFTTRSRQVCIDMDVDIKVGMTALNEEQSMELFELKVSLEGMLPKPILHPYVKQIVTKCGGLPLVLITVARAISGCVTIGEWEYTIQILSSAPEEIRGMDDVMNLLKFSFDHLKDEGIKSCLLYCALYPEDANIYTKDLIKQWIGEGFLDRSHDGTTYDFNRFYDRGIFVIKTLKSSCLLENGYFSLLVKMHDSIRDMAFWLTRKNYDPEYVLVYDKCNGCDIYDYHRWSRATRISLIRCQIDHLPGGGVPKCSKLLTLLLSENDEFYKFPSHDFFRFMPLLRVMDLSCTSLSEIPTSIGSLVELRYLNLKFTKIFSLPLALGKLKKLKLLNLSYTSQLKKIPKSAITGLLRLQELRLFCSAYEWDLNEPHNSYFVTSESQLLKLDDLKYLKYIEDFAMDICSTFILQKLINNQVLSHAMTCISLKDINLTDDLLMKTFSNIHGLLKLVIFRCNLPNVLQFDRYGYLPHLQILIFKELNISDVVLMQTCSLHSLQSLLIFKCPMLKELTWVSQLPFLERFCLIDCEGVDEIVVSSDVDDLYFPKLVYLYIENLKNARSLSREDGHFLFFQNLKVLKVIKCPMLRNLCFGFESAKNINLISGGQEWWDTLDWCDDAIELKLRPFFRSINEETITLFDREYCIDFHFQTSIDY